MQHIKKALKILFLFGLLVGFILAGLYAFYDKELPQGKEGPAADRLAEKMLEALNYPAYQKINYIEWTFSGLYRKQQYQWYKKKGRCRVTWDSIAVNLNLMATRKSTVEVNGVSYTGKKKNDFIRYANAKFNNDSFWLVAPYKLFDKGVERRLLKDEAGKDALLVTYSSGGTTPGDAYLWLLDETYKPRAYQMWVDLIPLGGLSASWENWKKTSQGAFLAQSHKIFFLNLEITGIKTK